MIRVCGWRDLGLLRRLTPLGVCLHSEAALTTGARVLQKGLVGLFAARRGATTLVWRGNSDKTDAFAQMQVEDSAQRARVYFLAPAGAETPQHSAVALLEGLAHEAGRRGTRFVMAEALEGSAAFAVLRSVGYAIYARQQVYRLVARSSAAKTDIVLEPCSPQDKIACQRLYSNIVPALVRQVESTPTGTDGGFFLRRDDDVVVLLSVNRGPKGIWVHPYVHPEAEDSIGEVLAAFLLEEELDAHRPVYVCARNYQSWLRGALQAAGFELWGQQTVMVKQLVVSARKPIRMAMAAINTTEVEISAPITKTSLIG